LPGGGGSRSCPAVGLKKFRSKEFQQTIQDLQ